MKNINNIVWPKCPLTKNFLNNIFLIIKKVPGKFKPLPDTFKY